MPSNQQSHQFPIHTAAASIASASASTSGARKRRCRTAHACVSCKRSKLVCQERRPCDRCVSRKIADSCIDAPVAKRRKRINNLNAQQEQQSTLTTVPSSTSSSNDSLSEDAESGMWNKRHHPEQRANAFWQVGLQKGNYDHPKDDAANRPLQELTDIGKGNREIVTRKTTLHGPYEMPQNSEHIAAESNRYPSESTLQVKETTSTAGALLTSLDVGFDDWLINSRQMSTPHEGSDPASILLYPGIF
jgi:hypothetical protein